MKMISILSISNILLLHFIKMVNSFYGWCSTTDTFCLYTEHVEYKVANLSEADKRCKVINNRGKPVEIESERVEKVFEEFAQNYSLTNVILNAINFNSEVINNKNFIRKGDKLVYKNDDSQSYYSVVCITECEASWIDYNNTRLTSHSSYFNKIETTKLCKDFCESMSNCSSIDWNPGQQHHGCWLHFYPYDIFDREDVNDDVSHHVIDRASKTIESCIGLKESSNANGNLIAILVPIILISIVLITAIIVIVVIFRKRKNKNDENSTDFEAYKSENHPGDDQPEIDKNSKQINKAKLQNNNNYVNVEFDDKEPKRYLGPSGDKYTEVQFDR